MAVLFFWWNGSSPDALYDHYLAASALADGTVRRRVDIAVEMAKSLAGLILKSVPGRPESGKWTKTPIAVDYALLFVIPVHIIQVLLAEAKRFIVVRVQAFDGKWQDLSFAESQSVRLQHTEEMFASATIIYSS